MTLQLEKLLQTMKLDYEMEEVDLNGEKLALISIPTRFGHKVWGIIDPFTLKLKRGIAKSSYKERYFAATNIFDVERRALEEIIQLEQKFGNTETVEKIKQDFLDFIKN